MLTFAGKSPASMAQRASASSTPPAPQRGVTYSSSAAAQQQSSSSSPAYPPPSLYKPPPHGQPLPRTHSHLLKSGELTSGIQAAEYEIRRSMLMSGLEDGAVVVCLGARMIYSSQSETWEGYKCRWDVSAERIVGPCHCACELFRYLVSNVFTFTGLVYPRLIISSNFSFQL